MKQLYKVLLCLVLIVSLVVSVSAASSVPKAVLRSTESVVRVLAEYADGYATGSGFVIKSDKKETLIATNYHVVEGNPYNISVWLSNDETVSATVLAYTDQKDMCILKLAYPVSLNTVVFSENGAEQGEEVYAVGFPGAADYLSDEEAHTSADATITDGIVSAVREATVSSFGTPTKILQINAAINSGNSGGPLFNAKGEVVGINTYGIDDSQGIFGAIDVSELKDFMADHSVSIPEINKGFPWWIVVAVLAVACTAVAFAIIMRKKKMKSLKRIEVKYVSLRDYMAQRPDGIGVNDAVAMLLPVALQLRDLHNNGTGHLEVSPDTIMVGENGATLNDATFNEANRYTSGFAAPEIYKGVSAGNLSDIYSFCAVLSFVVSGKVPNNALCRTDDELVEQGEDGYTEIVKTGMALDSSNRFVTMQDVIIKLSLYNTRPFVNTVTITEQVVSETTTVKRRKRYAKIISVIVAAVLVVALIGSYFGAYFIARVNAEKNDFNTADKLLWIPQITKLHDKKLVKYIEAGKKLDNRQYKKAHSDFEKLSGYMNAEELAKEASYRYAVQCADSNNFGEAITTMSTLKKDHYKDSGDKLLELQYRQGVYWLYEMSLFSKANAAFEELIANDYEPAEEMQKETQYLWALSLAEEGKHIDAYEKLNKLGNYADAYEVLDLLTELMYTEAQESYANDNFEDAETYFQHISSYKDSGKYIILIRAQYSRRGYTYDQVVEDLIEIFYFEDASEVLLSKQWVAERFLCGTWRGDGYYFTMKEDGSISYNLPWFNYGDYYQIEDGVMWLYPKGDSKARKALFEFTAVTPNCIEVYCYHNQRTYTLYRS